MKIRNLLDEHLQKKIIFFDAIQQKNTISKKNLVEILNISNFTLNQLLAEFHLDLLAFELSGSIQLNINKNSITLIENAPGALSLIKQTYLRRTILFAYLKDIYYNKIIDVTDFITTHHISTATFYRMLKKLNTYAKTFNLQFTASGKVEGTENFLRSFFVQLIFYVYKGTDYPFKFITYSSLKEYINYFYKIVGFSFGPIQESLYVYWIAVSLERVHVLKMISVDIEGLNKPINLELKSIDGVTFEQSEIQLQKYIEYFSMEYIRSYKKITEEQIEAELITSFIFGFYQYVIYDENSINDYTLMLLKKYTTKDIHHCVQIWIDGLKKEFNCIIDNFTLKKISINLFAIHTLSLSTKALQICPVNKELIIKEINMYDNSIIIKFNHFFNHLFKCDTFILLENQKEALYSNYLLLIKNNLTIFNKKKLCVSLVTKLTRQLEYTIIDSCPSYIKSQVEFIAFDEHSTDVVISDTNYLILKKLLFLFSA